MGTPRSKEHLLELANKFREKLHKDKPWIEIDLESYKGLKYTVQYFCNKHNYHGTSSGASLVKSKGCPTCQKELHFYSSEEYAENIRKAEAVKFIEKAKKVHGDKYTYSEDWYLSRNDALTKIWCNKHQEFFYQRPAAHIQGQNCPLCGKESGMVNSRSSEDEFIDRWSGRNKNSNLSIVKGSFTKYHAPVKVLCEIHGEFITTANNACVESCCALCNKEIRRVESVKQFISDAEKIHGDAYDYSNVADQYVTNRTKVNVLCKRHNEYFLTTRNKHIDSESGCPICAKDRTNRWTVAALEKDLDFYKSQECSVYLLRLERNGETFHKIGISRDMKVRLSLLQKELPDYLIEVVCENRSNTYDSLVKEKQFHKRLRKFRYTPDIKFGGYTECFVLDDTQIHEVKAWFI